MGTVRCHNPVAADIDVTDNCFCTVFFAGLYLSSSFNKTAIIFHKNNEVFVNCDMYLQCRRFASTHVYRHDVLTVPFNCPISPSNYKYDAYTVLLVYKSGW